MVKSSTEIIQETRDQFVEFGTVLVSGEKKANPQFNPDVIDSGYLGHTPNYWQTTVQGKNNKTHEPEEILNRALFRYEACELLYKTMDVRAPWFLTPKQMENPDVQSALRLIDEHTQRLRDCIKASFPLLSPKDPSYEKKMTLGLFALCFYQQGLGLSKNLDRLVEFDGAGNDSYVRNESELPSDIIDLLLKEKLGSFLGQLQTWGGLGLGTIEKDTDGEGSLYTVLTQKEGLCTEMAYTYFFVARRAGLDVGFASASIDGNDADHMHNIVTLSDGTKIAVDLAQKEINKKYSRSSPIGLNTVLADALSNFLIANEESESFSFETLNAMYARILAFDPNDAEILAKYAGFLWGHAVDMQDQLDLKQYQYYKQEAARYCSLALQYGGDNAEVSYNVASLYIASPDLGDSRPHSQYAYETFKSNSKSWSTDDLEYRDKWLALANTALALGYQNEALEIYERFLIAGVDLNTKQLIKYAAVLESYAKTGTLPQLSTNDSQLVASIDKSAVALVDAGCPTEAGYLLERLWLASPADTRLATLYKNSLINAYEKYADRFAKNALETAARYQKSFPKDALGYVMAGEQYFKISDYEKAASSFQTAMAMDPNNTSYRDNYEQSVQAMHDTGALDAYNALVEPFNTGRYAFVREESGKALEKYPTDDPLKDLYSSAVLKEHGQLLDSSDWPNGITLAQAYCKRFPLDAEGPAMLASIYFKTKDFAKAATYFDMAAELNPSETTYKENAAAARHNLKILSGK